MEEHLISLALLSHLRNVALDVRVPVMEFLVHPRLAPVPSPSKTPLLPVR